MHAKRLLIVDDDKAIVLTLAAALERLESDLSIETCDSSLEALDRIKHHAYALLLSDYSMPHLDGLELAQAAHEIAPAMPILIMTAYSPQILQKETEQYPFITFVSKPFSIRNIRALVADLIGIPLRES